MLSGLFNPTADLYSNLGGRGLVALKVSKLVITGGHYPLDYEFNFWGYNANITTHVVNTYEGWMVLVDDSVGKYVKSGGQLMSKERI
ncbi:hypothetical protein ANO14919_005840 [Xylariales sp. No.14919]|nr:hypothetical protein ANO14919_005840 [Xylariales sp. No.14919]